MSRKNLKFHVIGGILLVALSIVFVYFQQEHKRHVLVGSSHNHQRFVQLALSQYLNDYRCLPYRDNIPGHKLFDRVLPPMNARTNSNSGAPGKHSGGWQTVNLTPAQWQAVFSRWEKLPLETKELPYAWSGKPTGTGTRVMTLIESWKPDGHIVISNDTWTDKMLRDRLDRLNAILTELKLPAVTMDIEEK